MSLSGFYTLHHNIMCCNPTTKLVIFNIFTFINWWVFHQGTELTAKKFPDFHQSNYICRQGWKPMSSPLKKSSVSVALSANIRQRWKRLNAEPFGINKQ